MKHAIFLRGSIRTWNYIKSDILNFFNEYYGNPDWYVTLWESTTSTRENIERDFKQSNLKFLHLENHNNYLRFIAPVVHMKTPTKFYSSLAAYWRLAYLDHVSSMAKRRHEMLTGEWYKTVTFIRPDIVYELQYKMTKHELLSKLNELDEMDVVHQDPGNASVNRFKLGAMCSKIENFFVNDLIVTAGELAADIYGTRFIDTEFTDDGKTKFQQWDPHQKIAFIPSRFQMFRREAYLTTTGRRIVRPNDVIPGKENVDYEHLTQKEKDELCIDAKIDVYDYRHGVDEKRPSRI